MFTFLKYTTKLMPVKAADAPKAAATSIVGKCGSDV